MNIAARSMRQEVAEHSLYGIRAAMFPLWFSIILLVAGIRIGIASFESFDTSVWAAGASTSKIFLGVVGIILTPIIMPMYVSQGMTRRNFTIGGSIVMAGTALVAAVVMMLGFGVEHVAYSIAGITGSLSNIDVFGSVSRASMVMTSDVLENAAYFCSGWLIGSSYYRFGAWYGTLLLPATLVPMMIAEYFVGVGWSWDPAEVSGPARIYLSTPDWILGDIQIPYAVGAIVATLVISGGVWAVFRILRNATIK